MDGYVCENCYGSFIDPICEECQLKEFEAWLIDNGYSRLNRQIILKVIKKELLRIDNNSREVSNELCVVCNKAHIFSCPDCFDSVSLDVLNKFHAKKNTLDNFFKNFHHISKRIQSSIVRKRNY